MVIFLLAMSPLPNGAGSFAAGQREVAPSALVQRSSIAPNNFADCLHYVKLCEIHMHIHSEYFIAWRVLPLLEELFLLGFLQNGVR